MSHVQDPFFQGGAFFGGKASQMEAGTGLAVSLNMPKAVESRFGSDGEFSQGLPPYAPRAAFLVDDYPAAPEDWMRSTPGILSYMVAVAPEHGCWLDFTQCSSHTHDVAIVVSTQGVNAITAMKADKMRLEQYKDRCPKHDVPFGAKRRCDQCGYEWPAQNYLASTAPNTLWLDGFRTADGTVRQWVFTKEQERSVAKAVLGDERVHAFGVAFFLSKEPKPRPAYRTRSAAHYGGESLSAGDMYATRRATLGGSERIASALPAGHGERFEVAAGAKIDQKIHPDPKSLDYWQETPAGIVIINYTDVATLEAVIRAGKRQGNPEGALGALNVKLGHTQK